MRLTSLCKPTCNHEHSRSSLDFLRSPAGSHRQTRPGERPARGRNLKLGPSRRRSEEALDGAPSASVSSGSQPSPERGSRAARYRSPRREVRVGVPPGRRFRPSERREGAASDALCRSRPRWGFRLPSARGGPSLRTARPGARTAASAPLVKEGVALRPSAPFHRSHGPSATRLRGRFQAPFAGFLQSKRSTSTTAGTHRNPSPLREVALVRPGWAAALSRTPPAGDSQPRGPVAALAASASSRQCQDELPRNRSPPSTSFHGLVPRRAGGASLVRRHRREDETTHFPCLRRVHAGPTACAGAPEGRPPCFPREGETRLAAPEVPSGRGGCLHLHPPLSTGCHQSVGNAEVPHRLRDGPPSTTAVRHQRREPPPGEPSEDGLSRARALVALPRPSYVQ